MRFYQLQYGFYCGVDLHARTMHVCVVVAESLRDSDSLSQSYSTTRMPATE